MLDYRRATLADLPALLDLERAFPGDRLSRRSFRHLLTRANADVWICTEDGQVVGDAVMLYRNASLTARLYSIVIAPSARGRGIARALVRSVETAALQRSRRRIYLEVRADNAAAIGLYEKIGYRIVGRLVGFYEDGQDALRLQRSLVPETPQHRAA